jgi:hypothetical protein
MKGIPGLAALTGGLDIYNILTSDSETIYSDLAKSIAGSVGGVSGAALGGALGTLAVPVVGTMAGSLLGWMIGQWGGEWAAGHIIDWIKGGKEKVELPVVEPGGGSAKMAGAATLDQNLTPMAEGGIAMKPTRALIAEAGQPEAVLPLDKLGKILQEYSVNANIQQSASADQKMPGDVSSTSERSWESLYNELQRLNSISSETLKYIKETAEYSRRSVDATRALSGDLFSM